MKGLSAAGVEAECCGSSRVQAASQECLCLSACRLSGCGAAGEAKGRQKWCLCSCHVDTSLLPKKITFSPFKLAENRVLLDCCQKYMGSSARHFVHMG